VRKDRILEDKALTKIGSCSTKPYKDGRSILLKTSVRSYKPTVQQGLITDKILLRMDGVLSSRALRHPWETLNRDRILSNKRLQRIEPCFNRPSKG